MTRPLLPQTTPMSSSFAFDSTSPDDGLGYSKKNYVFVDEHNRHKRLKVMRACEGCRRRKIKCDAATTNTWPCAACVRLKLQCVPPTVNYTRSDSSCGTTSGLERVLDFDSSGDSGDESYMSHAPMHSVYQLGTDSEIITSQAGYTSGSATYSTSYDEKSPIHHMHYNGVTSAPVPTPVELAYQHMPAGHPVQIVSARASWPREDLPSSNLTDALGELRIDETGVAPYIYQQKKTLAEAPALEELEFALPIPRPGSGATVRIPPELMPEEAIAMEYFEIFFREVHPYVPVISKSYFYSQWHGNRASISPLLLEAIFACAARFSSDPAQGAQWLALAAKHESCFMDVPRLSTIQALVILLKGREGAPKRGYYYRSWMTVKTLVAMAKDLELDEHLADHEGGRPCSSDTTECLVKTRIWQAIFMAELMVGGPQARYDLAVGFDTVDFGIPPPGSGLSDDEYVVSRNFTYMVRAVRHVRLVNDIYVPIRKQQDWGLHPSLAALNPVFPKWIEELPTDMQIHYPPDGSAPWLPSHYVGNLHCYYHLSVLMLRRPQLVASSSFAAGGDWKQHMSVCYSSAKMMCRIQEALMNSFGLDGLLCMTRGVNFIIYCILVCTMVHLVAITSPDSDFNLDAKEYFERHMRILEACIGACPMKDLQAQVLSLREAFSADTSKPFVLKRNFPGGGGGHSIRMAASPPINGHHHGYQLQTARTQPQTVPYTSAQGVPGTPISAGPDDSRGGSMAAASLTMMASGQRPMPSANPSSLIGDESTSWNPTPIFDQWNTAFGTPTSTLSAGLASSLGQRSPSAYSPSASSIGTDLPNIQEAMQQQVQLRAQTHHYQGPVNVPAMTQAALPATTYASAPVQSYVSPTMWQDTVASTYGTNELKRRWDDGVSSWASPGDHQQMVFI